MTLNHVGQPARPGTMGTPLWGVSVRIVSPETTSLQFLSVGEIGEVVVRGHGLFLGYRDDPESTAAAHADGWFRTGDLGHLDANNRLTIVDRTKDLIIRGGYNVYPREVEEVIAAMPGVRCVAVFGVPDDRLGQEVVVAIIGDVTPESVLAYAKTHIATHKYPRRAIVLESFPIGPSGKVLKRELAQKYAR